MNKTKKKIEKFFKNIFVKNADHEIWIVSSVVLFLIFAVFAAYTYQPNFNRSVNSLLWGTSTQQTTQEKALFHLPVTIVYDSASQDQKTKMDEFLANLSDPQRALIDTDLQPTWLDYKTPQAKDLMAQSGLMYLPQVFIDPSIEQHPQFKSMQQYLDKKGNIYFIRLAPLENLATPPVDEGHAAGIDPSKAKVVIQDYESYSCDHCAEAETTLQQILKNYPTTVSVVYKHFEPGPVYNLVAQGAECAADQNKFFQMQDAIFKGQPAMLQKFQSITDQTAVMAYIKTLLESYAKTLRLNAKDFQSCLDNQTHSATVGLQTDNAIDYGVNQPPTFFINDKFQDGLLSYDQFKTIIDQELNSKK